MSVVANVAINVDSRNAVSKLREVRSQAGATERAFNGVAAAAGKLALAFGALQAIRFVFAKTAELESQTRSLEVLTGSAQKAGKIIKELQQLGAVTPFTSTELIDSAKRLQAFGIEADKVVATTKRLADVSGATGAELQGLVTAYGQVQAKGRLQGEELLQFQERGVALQEELRKMYGLSGEEFQKALEKGRIGAEAVEVAIIRLTNAGGKYANGAIAQSDTLQGKLSTLQDSFEQLARNIGAYFTPVFKFLIDGVNAFLERLNSAQRLGAEARANEQANIRTRNRFGLRAINPFDAEAQQYRERLRRSLVAAEMGATRGAAPSAPSSAGVPALLGGGGGGGAAGGRGGAAAAVRESRIPALERELEINEILAGLKQKMRMAELAGDKETFIRLNLEQEIARINGKQAEILASKEPLAEKQLELDLLEIEANEKRLDTAVELVKLQREELRDALEKLGITKQLADETERYRNAAMAASSGVFSTDINLDPSNKGVEQLDQYKKELDELTDKTSMAQKGAESIGAAFSGAFQGLITGAQTAQEALAGFFKNVGESFINMATEIIAKMVTMYAFKTLLGLFGGGGGGLFSGQGPVAMPGAGIGGGGSMFGVGAPSFMAEGGFVTGPTRAIVGEGGEPEYVIPASKMRGAMSRYAAGTRGSAVIPAGGDGSEPGAPAAGGTATLDVRYTVERINSVDYVTADQFQAGMRQAASQGAERGQQLALRRLQQSPSTRRRIGL